MDTAGVQAHSSTFNADPNFTFYADDMALITNGPAPIKKSYIYALGKHLARVDGVVGDATKPVYWYHADHLGTVEAMTNQAGAVVWRGDGNSFPGLSASFGLTQQ